MPTGLRGLDPAVLAEAGKGTPLFHQAGQRWLDADKPGTAILFENAKARLHTEEDVVPILPVQIPSADPVLHLWGGPDPFLEQIFARYQPPSSLAHPPILPLLIPRQARRELGTFLENSRNPAVIAVLANRQVKETQQFMPVDSSAGQPLEATLYLTALLLQGNHLSQEIAADLRRLADQANADQQLGPAEAIYLDLLALGSRLQWQALADLAPLLADRATLRRTAHLARVLQGDWTVFVAASLWSRNPGEISHYLVEHGAAGMNTLKRTLPQGEGALHLLLARQTPIHAPAWRSHLPPEVPILVAHLFLHSPGLASSLKVGALFLGCLGLFLAFHFLQPSSAHNPNLGRPLSLTLLQSSLLASVFSVTFILFSEPLLPHDGQTSEFRFQFPISFASFGPELPSDPKLDINMDQVTLISLGAFFGLQLIMYIICWIKIHEIRGQPLASNLKLKLLENEDHLFDSGLYLGLAGTVGALIFLALGVIGPSLMAAYASTLFGIVFVALFKIFHLRPYRRRLIIESQAYA